MVRDDGANVWGVVIGHNSGATDPEGGTCLFVNVRPAGGPPTGGSIGIPSESAAALVRYAGLADATLLMPLTPNPGTPEWRVARASGDLASTDYSQYNFLNPVLRTRR